MPLIQIKGVQNHLTLEKKQALISKITDAVAELEGEGIRQVTWVMIEDVPEGAWGVAGTPVSADFLKSLGQSS